MDYCIPKEKSDKLRADLIERAKRGGRKSKLSDMGRAERLEYLSSVVGEQDAQVFNKKYEAALVSKKANALKNFIKKELPDSASREAIEKRVQSLKEKADKEIAEKNQSDNISYINVYDTVVDSVVEIDLGIDITADEFKKLSEITQKLNEFNVINEDPGLASLGRPNQEYWKHLKEMESFIEKQAPNSGLDIFTSLVSRSAMLGSLASPTMNIISTGVNSTAVKLANRRWSEMKAIVTGDKKQLRSTLPKKYDIKKGKKTVKGDIKDVVKQYNKEVYNKYGFDLTNSIYAKSTHYIRGEKNTAIGDYRFDGLVINPSKNALLNKIDFFKNIDRDIKITPGIDSIGDWVSGLINIGLEKAGVGENSLIDTEKTITYKFYDLVLRKLQGKPDFLFGNSVLLDVAHSQADTLVRAMYEEQGNADIIGSEQFAEDVESMFIESLSLDLDMSDGSMAAKIRANSEFESLKARFQETGGLGQVGVQSRTIINTIGSEITGGNVKQLGTAIVPFAKSPANAIGQGITDGLFINGTKSLINLSRINKEYQKGSTEAVLESLAYEASLKKNGIFLSTGIGLALFAFLTGAEYEEEYTLSGNSGRRGAQLMNRSYGSLNWGGLSISLEYFAGIDNITSSVFAALNSEGLPEGLGMYSLRSLSKLTQIPGPKEVSDFTISAQEYFVAKQEGKSIVTEMGDDLSKFIASRTVPAIGKQLVDTIGGERDYRGNLLGPFASRTGIGSTNFKYKRNAFGERVTDQKAIFGLETFIGGSRFKLNNVEPSYQEVYDLNKRGAKVTISLPGEGKGFVEFKNIISNEEVADEALDYFNKYWKDTVEETITQESYTSLPDEDKALVLNEIRLNAISETESKYFQYTQ